MKRDKQYFRLDTARPAANAGATIYSALSSINNASAEKIPPRLTSMHLQRPSVSTPVK